MTIDSDTTLRDLGRALARLPGKPDLALRCDDGCWWAVLGDRRTGHGILHSGLTPADAIASAIEAATQRREETAPRVPRGRFTPKQTDTKGNRAMTHRYTTDSRWMHDHWTSMADDDELTISAGGLRQWMAECLARSLGQPIAVEQHDEDRSQTIARVYQQHKRLQHEDVYADDEPSEEPSYELEDHQDEAGPTLHEGNQPEPAAPDEESSFLNRFFEALHGESASQPDDTSDHEEG